MSSSLAQKLVDEWTRSPEDRDRCVRALQEALFLKSGEHRSTGSLQGSTGHHNAQTGQR